MPSFDFSNQDIAQLIRHVAAVYVIQAVNPFRIKAYDAAANSIEQLSVSLKELWAEEQLDEVPGLGKTIIGYIDELFKTGEIGHFKNVMKEVPAGMFPLVDLPGIGPKIAYKLANTLELYDEKVAIKKVKEAAQQGLLAGLPGISDTLQKKILDITSTENTPTQQRMLLSTAMSMAESLVKHLKESSVVLEAEALGSLRRRLPTVGDIDIAVATEHPAAVVEHLKKFPPVSKVIAEGEKSAAVRVAGMRIDVKFNPPAQWGSLLQHYTGSKLHNIELRNFALSKSLSLSEFGIKKDGELLTFAKESEFYEYLGLEFVPPELRENTGEVAAAAKKMLPQLIEQADLKGDFHIHTAIPFPTSHDLGASSVADYLAAAEKLGYTMLGFADHNPKRQDLDAAQRLKIVKEHNDAVDQAVAEYFHQRKQTIKVYKGMEVDIFPNGELALEDQALAELDYVIVSIHSAFDQDRKVTTERILKALSNPYVKIMGHPTGRRLGKRAGVQADWDQIFSFAAEHEIYMEINASAERMDLPYDLIKIAHQQGVKFIINSDSHHEDGLMGIRYGVWNARKGWLTAKDVVNTREKIFA